MIVSVDVENATEKIIILYVKNADGSLKLYIRDTHQSPVTVVMEFK